LITERYKNVKVLYEENEINEINDKYFILFHEKAIETIALPKVNMKKNTTLYPTEVYYCASLAGKKDNIYGERENWYNVKTDLVRVKCDQIKDKIINGDLKNDLIIFCHKFVEKSNNSYYQFDTEQYSQLSNTTLEKISISLTDENNNYLDVSRGISTFAKLKFKKMNFSEFFNLRICSDVLNNDFTVTLPQPYYLDSGWKVALTSINYPSTILPLPYESRLRTISGAKIGSAITWLTLENKSIDLASLLELSNQYMKTNILGLFIMKKHKEFGVEKNKITLKLEKDTFFMISEHLAELLGFPFEEIEDGVDNGQQEIVRKNKFIIFVNKSAVVKEFNFKNNASIENIKPEYLMLYTNIIESCIVGDEYVKLLKIVPLHKTQEENYKIEEFRHLEYHPLESTLIREISIQIRTHSGELINFPKTKKVFLNLLFTR
ncbi:MAG: hypothetical protein Q8O25_01960, partial [Sulfurisoma sp.]|nr:hypothetical protein [Sulfurisoma sp.]